MANPGSAPLPPGNVIGILGGGQLGRMSALAAARLGYRCRVYCPEADSPAGQVTPLVTTAPYDDEVALAAFAESVDVITLEFENIPLATARFLAERRDLRPGPEILRICQNRLREKDFCNGIGIATVAYRAVADRSGLEQAVRQIGRPAILKTTELGYDGKGQQRIDEASDLDVVWQGIAQGLAGTEPPGSRDAPFAVLEGFADLRLELSVIVARGPAGTCVTYPAVENRHRNQILDQTHVPGAIPAAVGEAAEEIAGRLAQELGLIGLLAVEMFLTRDGALLVNELAPRPHNSGHWTLDACATSQFEQLVRAVAGLPLGSTRALAEAVMQNLLGDQIETWPEILAEPEAKLHLYGKTEARPGRKMGHVTRLGRRL